MTCRTRGAVGPQRNFRCAPSPEPTSSTRPLRSPACLRTAARSPLIELWTAVRRPSVLHTKPKNDSRARFEAASTAMPAMRGPAAISVLILEADRTADGEGVGPSARRRRTRCDVAYAFGAAVSTYGAHREKGAAGRTEVILRLHASSNSSRNSSKVAISVVIRRFWPVTLLKTNK